MARSSYVEPTSLGLVLAALQPANRLVFEVMLATGLRVSDVLNIKTAQVKRQRFTVKEQKTGKSRRVLIPRELQLRILRQAGRLYAFEGRYDWRKHRTRQAVWLDCSRCARFFQHGGAVPKGTVSPHSARKVYAVDEYHRTGDLDAVRQKLNHDPAHVATTLLYALSDKLDSKALRELGKQK
ncbi:tyrosine-type recombinase/integrase [Subdoligranulum variabile]|uniref:tyrosine-type recombinase/integrase n=1 Tax=Subdoligranulum variabile TaxID=214851 RepID=UPI0026EAEFCD|nr:tyrosine-type recombinase/integrase [Subdoligranulum variabile]